MVHLLAVFLVSLLYLPGLPAAQPVRARHAMVVAQEPLATDVGVAVLKAGGNAVDAAVAVAFALAVTHPFAGNLGGGGFLLIRFADGRSTFIDFREAAPAKATHDMYLDAAGRLTRDSLVGWRASGVPGTVRGLAEHRRTQLRKGRQQPENQPSHMQPRFFTKIYGYRFALSKLGETEWVLLRV